MSSFSRRWLSLTRLTLFQLFLVAILIITLVVGVGFFILIKSSRSSILADAQQQHDVEAKGIVNSLMRELDVAENALENLERDIHHRVVNYENVTTLEAFIFAELINQPTLSDITFTHAKEEGFKASGKMQISPQDRWQLSVFRTSPIHPEPISTRFISKQNSHFVADIRSRSIDGMFNETSSHLEPMAADPTKHLTFETITQKKYYGDTIWSDLHWSEIDAALPEAQRRVVVSVQKAIENDKEQFIGVLRVGLNTNTINELPGRAQQSLAHMRGGENPMPPRVFVSDRYGRLITKLDPHDKLEVEGDDLRVVSTNLDPVIAAALANPGLRTVQIDKPVSSTLDVEKRQWLVTYRMLKGKRQWIVGIAIPEDVYTHELSSLRDRFYSIFGLTSFVAFLAGVYVLRQLRKGLGSIVTQTSHMRALDFESTTFGESFRDIKEVHNELERAKTSMRSLCKYVPLTLVRDLYLANREPTLGGELRELSIMFTDIQGFTSLSEKLSPDVLAKALGLYLKEMTEALQANGGTVDKFIGDAVMALWNAPHQTNAHAVRACRAIQESILRLKQLYTSPEWQDLPPLVTRYGLHVGSVMVGHFGAPDRFSYTALGDGVNLASRLEELCKQYGLVTLVSEDVVKTARNEFVFRLIDKVAVKGKTKGVKVYELLGTAKDFYECSDRFHAAVAGYQIALEEYFKQHFDSALKILAPFTYDPPSVVLAERCKSFIATPPPAGWDGVYIAKSK